MAQTHFGYQTVDERDKVERVRALAGRAESLTRAASTERRTRAQAAARREQLRREAQVGAAAAAGLWFFVLRKRK